MIPTPTPEANGEPLSDVQSALDELRIAVEALPYNEKTARACLRAYNRLRELQQRRAASLPAAQGGDVAALRAAFMAGRSAHVTRRGWHFPVREEENDDYAWAAYSAALDARPSPPQAGELASQPHTCMGGDPGSSLNGPCYACEDEKRVYQQPARVPSPQGAPEGVRVIPIPRESLDGNPFRFLPQGAPEASVEALARETADAVCHEYDEDDDSVRFREVNRIILAALQRARETGR